MYETFYHLNTKYACQCNYYYNLLLLQGFLKNVLFN